MFNKIIKRGTRKFSKSDSSSESYTTNPSTSSASVTVNHSSRTTLLTSVQPDRWNNANTQSSPPPASGPVVVETLPAFRDVPVSERQNLFLQKLQICSIVFDFGDTLKFAKEKEAKRQTLLELVDFVQSGSGRITERVQEELVRMISLNIFRCLPPASHENTGSEPADPTEEDEPYYDPAWPHLQIVYELLLRYVMSSDTDTKIAKRYVDHSFVLHLLDLFNSEDPREREYLKTILHRIYGKFMVHRPFIRKAINNIFYWFVFETERYSGTGELLEILGSIINGFALPMKEEHKLFLVRALLPLHKPKSISTYHHQLSYCITQFVEKDYKLADTVIRGLLRYWPLTNCQKEVLFLGELEEVLEATQLAEFQRCMTPLFKQIARCLNSSHFQGKEKGKEVDVDGLETQLSTPRTMSEDHNLETGIIPTQASYADYTPQPARMSMPEFASGVVAERALFLWNNEHIVSLIAQNRSIIFPIVFEALEKNIQSHWNQAVHGLTANVRKMFLEMDGKLFEECQRQYIEKMANSKALEEQRQLTWKRLEEMVASKTPAGGDYSVPMNWIRSM